VNAYLFESIHKYTNTHSTRTINNDNNTTRVSYMDNEMPLGLLIYMYMYH